MTESLYINQRPRSMLGPQSPALVMACWAALALASAERMVLRCLQYTSADQCKEVSHNRFLLNNGKTVDFSYEAENFIRLKCELHDNGDYMEILHLGILSPYLPRFQPALHVHNVAVVNCQSVQYSFLFVKLNVTLVTPFNLELDNNGEVEPLTAAHCADLPPLHHLILRRVYGNLHKLPTSLDGLTVEDTSLLNSTLLEELPLTLNKLRLVRVKINRVPAAVLYLPELRSLYVECDSPWHFMTVERGNASQLQQLHVFGADSALLSEWAPPVLEEVTLKHWQAKRPAPVPACDKLVKLTLYRPNVLDFPTGWVARCPHLKELHIEAAYDVWKPKLAGFLENVATLTSFSIRGTHLSLLPEQLFANTSNLAHLDLRNNKLIQLQSQLFANTSNLTHLNLSYNNLVQLEPELFANTPNLTYLDLSDNNLKQLHPQLFANTPHLMHLDLSFNELKQLQPLLFANTPHLTHLDLSFNKLIQLQPQQFANTPHLTHLDLSFNKLIHLQPQQFANTPHLMHLDLSFNEFIQLQPKLFSNTPNLTYLDLSFNNLIQLQPQLFANISNLAHLDLRDNKLLELQPKIRRFSRIVLVAVLRVYCP